MHTQKNSFTKARTFDTCALISFLVLAQTVPLLHCQRASADETTQTATATSGSEATTNVNIAQGATHVIDVSDSSLAALAGNLNNQGILYLISTNPLVNTATLSAQNIFNGPGATITTILPTGGLPNYTNAIANLSLSLVAINDIVNYGNITSANNLTAIAGGSIFNVTQTGAATATMQAVNNLSVLAANITNSGTLAALNGSINIANPSLYNTALASLQQSMSSNIASMLQNNININNTGGLIQALNGTVNIGGSDLAKNTVLSILGGDILTNALNIDGGSGSIQGNLNSVTGIVNMQACAAQFGTNSESLTLGNITLTDDPTYFNTGDITITGNVIVGESLAFLAGGSISSLPGVQIKSNISGVGNNITFIAGAEYFVTGTPVGGTTPPGNALLPGQFVSIKGGSLAGGSINLNGATVDASSSVGNNAGGNVLMVAYGGPFNGGIQNATIITGGSGTGAAGNVTLVAGGVNGVSNSAIDNVSVAINGGPTFVPGNVEFYAAQPLAFGLFTSTGSVFAGAIPLTPTTRDINITAPIQTDGGKVNMKTGGDVNILALGSINTSGVGLGRNAGDIKIEANNIGVSGALTAVGQTGAAGKLGISGSAGGAGGAGGNGGMVTLNGTTSILISANIDASGGNGGKGGDGGAGSAQQAGGAGGGGGMGGSAGGLTFKTKNGIIAQGMLSTIKSTGGDAGAGGNGGQGGAPGAFMAGAGGMGGSGGTARGGATFLADSGSGAMTFQGVINLQGGAGGNAGNGGNGGSDLTKAVLGGSGGSTGFASGGAPGGTANLTTTSGNITLGSITGVLNLNGGAGGQSGASGAGGDGNFAGSGGLVFGSGGGGGGGTMIVTSTSGDFTLTGLFGMQLKGGDGGVMANNSGKGGDGSKNGGNGGTMFGAGGGGGGGKLTVNTAGEIISTVSIDASGGAGGSVTGTAGNGGSGTIMAGSGGSLGGSGGGGLGGGISLTTTGKGISLGGLLSTLSTSGGAGGNITGTAGNGGNGTIATASGGGGGGIGGGGGGALGQRIALSAKTGILVSAQLNATGGAGGSISGTAGTGGNGGASPGAIAGAGGAILSAGGGAGGGTIDIRTSKGPISLAGINANGGNGGSMTGTSGAGGDASSGGAGGRVGDSGGGGGGGGISLNTSQMTADGGAISINLAPVQASGGAAGLYTAKSGNGGKGLSTGGGDGGAIGNQNSAGGGGQIYVTGLSLSVGSLLNQSSIRANGGSTSVDPGSVATYVGYAPQSGDGGNAAGSSRGGNGGGVGMAGSGGIGGYISINMPGTITLQSDNNGGDVIAARGGVVADNRARSGKGGNGGPVSGLLSSGGGNGGDIGKNGNGGNGGTISIVGGAGDMGGIAVVVANGGSVGVPDFLFPGVRGMEAISGAGGDAGPSGQGGKSGNIGSNGGAGNGGFIFVSSTSGGIDIANFIVTGGDINAIYRPQTGAGGKGGTNGVLGGSGGDSGVIGDNGRAGNGGLFFAFTSTGKFGPPTVTPLKLTNILAGGGAVLGAAAITGIGGNATSGNGGNSGLIGNNGIGGTGGAIFISSLSGNIETAKGVLLLTGGDAGYNTSKTGNGGITGGGKGGSSGSIGNNGNAGNAGFLSLLTGGDIKLGGNVLMEGGATYGNLAQTGEGGTSTGSRGGASGGIGYGGDSGSGGLAFIFAGKSFVSSELINLNGGNSVKGLYAPRTGNGGNGLTFGGGSGVIESQGKSGNAGSISVYTLTPLTGDIAPDRFSANGGSAGGTVILPNNQGTITFDGKMSAITGNGGNGGQTGGDAGKIGNASNGGNGGTIFVSSAAKLINAAQFTANGGNGAQQDSKGGNGGTGTLAGGGAGGAVGASGDGGNSERFPGVTGITLSAKLGPTQLKSIEAFGGNGGVNSGTAGNGGNGGLAGGAGGDLGISGSGGAGGSVSLTFGGDTLIESNTLGNDPLKMYGGNGGNMIGSAGNGGNGTGSPVVGPPAGTTGGAGGKGGSLFGISGGGGNGGTLNANITGLLSIVENTNLNGGDTGLYSATAGKGGTGTAGTLPNTAQAGGAGGATGDQGKGGNGGTIGPTFTVGSLQNNNGFSFLANGGSALEYSAIAGAGGAGGGQGGAGGSTGAPGAGGRGGGIGISSSGNIVIDGTISVNGGSRGPVTAVAGDGANAGLAGGGGGDAGSITGTGDAGTAGKITLQSKIGNVTGMGTLTANGGNIIMGATQVKSGTGGNGVGVGTGGIGGNVDRQGDGGNGGMITVFANGFINLPFYVANGGTATASFNPTVGSGGNGTNDGVRIGVGGQAGSIIGKATSGGNGGSVELRSFLGDITPTQITAAGGNALDFLGVAGNGGNQIAGLAGNGGNGGKAADNGNGGVGGTVTISTFGKVEIALDLNISGGNVGGYSGKGGNGGQNFGISGNGGNGGDTGSNGSGGKGGSLTISSFDGNITLKGSVLADGGSQLGNFTGVGGKGGSGPSIGGGGGTAGSNGASGEGGNLLIFTIGSGDIIVDPGKKLSFNAGTTSIHSGIGGDAGTNSLNLAGNAGGMGGTVATASTGANGGNLFIYSTNGDITLGGDVLANGATGGLLNGTAGKGGDGAPKGGGGGTVAGAGKGGNGGLMFLTTFGGKLTTGGVVQANGGFGGSQLGVAGNGGNGIIEGGRGGDAASAGNGGNGGYIFRTAGGGKIGATPTANLGLGGLYLGTVGTGGTPNGLNGTPGMNGVPGMAGFVSHAIEGTDENGLPGEGKNKRRIALRRTAETRFNENGTPYLSAGVDYNAAVETHQPSGLSDLIYADYVQVPEQLNESNKPVSLVQFVPAPPPAKSMYKELEGSTAAVVTESLCHKALTNRVAEVGAELLQGNADSDFEFKQGELMFAPAEKPVNIALPNGKLKVGVGAKVLVEVTDAGTIVRTLHDRKLGDVVFVNGRSVLPVTIGHQLAIANGDSEDLLKSQANKSIATRKTATRKLPCGLNVSASEFSLVSAISTNPILKTLSRSQHKADRKHMEQIIKSTCIVSFLTMKHGPFQK